MTEDSLKHLSLDDLYGTLLECIAEYLSLHKLPADHMNIEAKRNELELIQKMITRKKSDDPV